MRTKGVRAACSKNKEVFPPPAHLYPGRWAFNEKSGDFIELLNQHSKQTIKALWKEMRAFMKSIPYTPDQLQEFISG